MEQETILYYHPLPVRQDSADNTIAAKKHWFQEAVLRTTLLTEQEEFCVLGCAVPPFYYRKKVWKAQVLSEAMETAQNTAVGMTDVCAHPDILRLLAPEMQERWQPCERTIKMLTKDLLGRQAGKTLARTGTVTVLLGCFRETEQQLETIRELLEPYLPRVNRMLLYYEGQERQRESEGSESAGGTENVLKSAERAEIVRGGWLAGIRKGGSSGNRRSVRETLEGRSEYEEAVVENDQEALQEYLEDYYYEYGLVPQLVPYKRSSLSGSTALRCGKERCGGVILDYGNGFRYPKFASADCVYIDVTSDDGKERLLGRKSPAIPYISPLKYLDTLVKNSYDRKVKMT